MSAGPEVVAGVAQKPRRRPRGGERSAVVRLLPLFIAVASLAVMLRLGDVVLSNGDGSRDLVASMRGAIAQEPAAGDVTADADAAAPSDDAMAGSTDAEEPPESTEAGSRLALAEADDAETPAQAAQDEGVDPTDADESDPGLMDVDNLEGTGLSQSELEVLQQLSARREALDRRARDLDQREAVLEATEAQLTEKMAELEGLRGDIEALLDLHHEQSEERITQLVTIYERMRARDAARIFDDLELPVLLEVVGRMREVSTAQILGEMNPDRARELTSELIERGQFPDSGVLN